MERGWRRNDFTKNDYSSEVSCIDKKGIAWNTWRKVAVGMSMEMERRFLTITKTGKHIVSMLFGVSCESSLEAIVPK